PVRAAAGMTQQKSRCANVWRAAAAAPTRVMNCRRVQWVGIGCLLKRHCSGPWVRGYLSFHTAKSRPASSTSLRLVLDHRPPSAEAFLISPGRPVPIGCYALMLLCRNFHATTPPYTDF